MFSTFPSAAAPDPDDDRNDSHRKRMNAKSRKVQQDVCEIGLPPERDWELWNLYQHDLERFLAEVFPHSTGMSPFSRGHKQLIANAQETVLLGGQDLNEVFRGGFKSTITENTAIWATGYGHRAFFCPIGATDEAAQQALDSIQMEFTTNDRLMALFPAACHAARALEGIPQRARKQTMGGRRTMIEWTTARCILPTYEGFEGSAAIVWPRSITASGLRGMRCKRPDGVQARPDYVMLDDPQTDESAASNSQINKRMKIVRSSILRLAGHSKSIACTVNATPIEPNDLCDRMERDPAWRLTKIPILKSRSHAHDSHWSFAHDTHWLAKYAELRQGHEDGKSIPKKEAIEKSNAYYSEHRDVMNAGAEASCPDLYNASELSAIQHAYNLLLEMGEEAFMSECMLNPPKERTALQRLTVEQICDKQSEYDQGIVPPDCTVLVAKVDVHPEILYANIWAYAPGMTGYLVDYPTFPEQPRDYFSHTSLSFPCSRRFKDMDTDAVITAALQEFLIGDEAAPGLLQRTWPTSDGKRQLRLVKVAIDGNGQANTPVTNFINGAHQYRGVLYAEFGRGITAKQAPMARWPEARVQTRNGPAYIDTKDGGSMFDTNYWKTRFHRALALAKGSQGALYLFKANPKRHLMYAEHCLAEPVKEGVFEGRTVYEFGDPKAGQGNHDFDCGVGCMVAASRAGISNLNKPTGPKRDGPRKAKSINGW